MTHPQDSFPEKISASENQIQQDIGRNQGQAFGQMYGGQAVDAGVFISGGSVVFQNSQGGGLPQALMNGERAVPSLLPYLPNRTDQEFELGRAVQKLMTQTPRRPLVCIVHGDEFQSHDKFLERLRKVSLPRLLRLDLRQTAVKEYHLGWPSSLKNLKTLPDRLCKNLADTVENYSLATVEQINQTFGKCPGPVVIHLHLLTEDWQRLGSGLLPKILEFWQQWPDLTPDQTLFICIFIKYQIKRPTNMHKWWWILRPITMLRRFLRCRRCHKLNLKIDQQLKLLAESEFREFDRLTGVVLPKLDNLTQGHVEDWVRCEATKTFAGEAVLGQLVDAVREMFDHWEIQTASRTMSMDEVAMRLTELLKFPGIDRREY